MVEYNISSSPLSKNHHKDILFNPSREPPGGPSGGFIEPSHMFSIIFLLDPLSKNCHKYILFIQSIKRTPRRPIRRLHITIPMFSIIFLLDPLSKNYHKDILFI